MDNDCDGVVDLWDCIPWKPQVQEVEAHRPTENASCDSGGGGVGFWLAGLLAARRRLRRK